MLADRFGLKLHRESKEVQGYVLAPEKKGPKLVEAKVKTIMGQDRIRQVSPSLSVVRLSARSVSMPDLADY
jgi:uncharacterized protein (TIGR03435 family)